MVKYVKSSNDLPNLSAFVTDDYRKGNSNTSIPSAISSYAENDLVFEFEGQFNEAVARQFADKFLADHKLYPKRIDVLDFYDEDLDSDNIIGVVVSCKF